MNPYIIDRPEFNLVDAFSRGREQAQNFRINQQNQRLNEQTIADNEYKIGEAKRLQQENEKIKQIFGGLLKQFNGNVDQARQAAVTQFPEYAQVLSRGFAQLRGDMPDPIKQQQDQLGLQSDRAEMTKTYVAPMVKKFLELPEPQRLEQFSDFNNFLNQNFDFKPPQQWIDQGYTPEVGQQLEQLATIGDSQKPFITFEQKKELEQLQQNAMNERAQMNADLRLKGLDISREGNVIKREGLGIRKDKQDRDFKIQDVEMGTKIETLNDNLDSFDELYKTTSDIYNNRELWANAGLGKIGAKIPGTVAADIKSNLQYVVDNLVIPTFANAKAQGVTFGAASEKEWEMIKNGVANLDQNQSPESYRANVFRIMKKIERFKAGAERESKKYQTILEKEPNEKTNKTIQMVRDPKTGKLVRK